MTCPRCDRADCNAVTGRAGPPDVIVVERRCDGDPVDWRARALSAEAARLRAALDACTQALADHGAHGPACPRLQGLDWCDCGDCDVCRACGCGLDAAIASAEAALAAAKGGAT